MENAESKQGPSKKMRKKDRINQILELFRIFLSIPDDIPKGGPELKQYLMNLGSARLKMAKDTIRPLCPEISKDFKNYTLYRWALSNGSIHKGSIIESPGVKEFIQLKSAQGCSVKNLQYGVVPLLSTSGGIQKKKVSRSTIQRAKTEIKSKHPQEPYKKVKFDVRFQNSIAEDISTQISPSIEILNFPQNENQSFEISFAQDRLKEFAPLRFDDSFQECIVLIEKLKLAMANAWH